MIAVSFDSSHDRLYVEQAVFDSSLLGIELHRKISVFSLSDLRKLTERIVDTRTGPTLFLPTCDAVSADITGSYITVCLDDRITVMESTEMVPVKSFRLPDGMASRGMAVDEKHSEVIVLLGPNHQMSPRASRNFILAVYDWKTGIKKSSYLIDTATGVSTAKLVFDPDNGAIAVGILATSNNKQITKVFSCSSKERIACAEKATTGPIGSMAIDGSRLLFGLDIESGLQRCIAEMDLHTGAMSQRYCGAEYAIRGGLALSAGLYALAFTGTSRYNTFTENTTNIQDSFALWSKNEMNRPRTIKYTLSNGMAHGLVTIVGDAKSAEFAVFTKQDDSALIVVKLSPFPKMAPLN